MAKKFKNEIKQFKKIPHPRARKVAQLTKKVIRSQGREKSKLAHQMKLNLLGEKILWFKENLKEVDKYTPSLTIELIESYLGRFDDELEQIKIKHMTGLRKGRQHANREDIINITVKNERNEYVTAGIEMPDVLNVQQLNLLKNWSGELRYIQNFKLVRYTKSKLEKLKSNEVKGKCNSPKEEDIKIEEPKSEEKVCDSDIEKNNSLKKLDGNELEPEYTPMEVS